MKNKPARRNIQHLLAKVRSGAGSHPTTRKPGPSIEDWEDEEEMQSHTEEEE